MERDLPEKEDVELLLSIDGDERLEAGSYHD